MTEGALVRDRLRSELEQELESEARQADAERGCPDAFIATPANTFVDSIVPTPPNTFLAAPPSAS